jgi:hypothetical protein
MRGNDFDNPALGKAWEDLLAFMGEYDRPRDRMALIELSPDDLLKMTSCIEHAVQVTKPPAAHEFARALFYFSLGRAYGLRKLSEVPPE